MNNKRRKYQHLAALIYEEGMKKKIEEHEHLALLVYIKGLEKQIEKRIVNKYLKRIDYLVAANNELMYELEQCELEKIGNVSIPYSVADSILLEENV